MKRRTRPRLADIAAAAGVSLATASRTLSQPSIVSPETRDRVRAAVARLGGAAPGAGARAVGDAGVAAVVPTLDNAIFSRCLQAMQVTLAEAGRHLLVASSDFHPDTEAAVIRGLLARGVDGLVLVGAQRPADSWTLLEGAGVPVVLTWCGDPRFDAVVVDNHAAGRLAADHLLDLGHTRLGVVCGATRFNDRQRGRLAGVREALAARGLDLPEWRVSEQDFTLAGGRSGCSALLSLAEPPTAIVCGIDQLAVGCLIEAQSRGLAVPGDLSVVGIDNLEMAAHLSPPLTTVHVPTARIGAAAAQRVLDRLAGRDATQLTELPIELVIRRSSAPPGIE
ncbi:substrate-binding domain-containing protein [Neoroseomonas oryzicola]|uniref:LacI family transcriptional regulator n=3 Tax=Neoroseomonas oryzicola TaxID=535904 RepID=A0ABX1EGF4_9PROT|nr:substrate-binding domain-containing protein [Neoroseomonas oryzicola]NKE16729.1 LacI family transcriptional regulator [Neoroseomonas oryzicola]